MQGGSQFIRPNMKARILRLDPAGAQRSILNLWRQRMGDGIAENPHPNRRINITRYLTPLLEIGKRVALGSWPVFFHLVALSLTCHPEQSERPHNCSPRVLLSRVINVFVGGPSLRSG